MKHRSMILLHGFTSGPFAFEFLVPLLEGRGIPLTVPTLSGHCLDSWKEMSGFTREHWLEDARVALESHVDRHGSGLMVGHSMGGLLALNLAADNPGAVDGLVLAGTPLLLASPFGPGRPLGFLEPLMKGLFRSWDMTPFYTDPSMLETDRNYRRAPMASISELMALAEATEKRLHEVTVPTLILQGRRDRRAHWKSADMIRRGLSTPDDRKRVILFEKTDHEMFRDCEREPVIREVLGYLVRQDP